MYWRVPVLAGGLSVALLASPEPARTAPVQESGQESFYEAYWQERQAHDWEAAAKLYRAAAGDASAPAELRARAAEGLGRCQEELAAADFARLMPPDPWAYFEVSRPGQHAERLLRRLGLLRDGKLALGEGERSVQISPELVRGLLGVRGLAVAVTGFNPATQAPNGVAVLHPGDLELVRGLIESALPAAVPAAEPIEGYPTWKIENRVWVALTDRLVVASPTKVEIRKVLRRLKGEGKSLADNPVLIEAMGDRDQALGTFLVNAKPIVPLLKLAAMGAPDHARRQIQIAEAALDPEHLSTLAGHLSVRDDGLSMDLCLQLDEGHHNLVFNLLRTPQVPRSTLERIPAGAAAFGAWAFNEYHPGKPVSDEPEVVTAMDLGRELFGNLASVAVFALPAEGQESGPIPDAAAVLTVNDPAKSTALWSLLLGFSSLASGGGPLEGEPVHLDGAEARSYAFPNGGPTVYAAIGGNEIVLATTENALRRSVAAPAEKDSVFSDPNYARLLQGMGTDANQALFVHAGRVLHMALPYMGAREVAGVEPYQGLLDELVLAFVVSHTRNQLRIEGRLAGLPRVDGLVARALQGELGGGGAFGTLQAAAAPVPAGRVRAQGASLEDLFEANARAADAHSLAVAQELGRSFVQQHFQDAGALNEFAWKLLSEEAFRGRFTELAHTAAVQANELTGFSNWMFLDTLAHAEFARGDAGVACELERQALENVDPARADEVKAALERFESARREHRAAARAGALR